MGWAVALATLLIQNLVSFYVHERSNITCLTSLKLRVQKFLKLKLYFCAKFKDPLRQSYFQKRMLGKHYLLCALNMKKLFQNCSRGHMDTLKLTLS